MNLSTRKMSFLLHFLGGILLGLAWLQTDNYFAPFFTVVSVVCLLAPGNKLKSSFFLYGLTAYLIAFYWLVESIRSFAGYPLIISWLIFLLFCGTQALIFPLTAWLYQKLQGSFLAKIGLSCACSWVTIKYLFPEIFPWDYAHTLVEVWPVAKLAQFGGSALVSFIFLSFLEILITRNKSSYQKITLTVLLIGSLVIFISLGKPYKTGELKISVIQGPIQVKKYQGVSYLTANVADYWQLSLQAIQEFQPELIIWPESTIVEPVPHAINKISAEVNLPYHPETNFLTGAISQGEGSYNSAFLIKSNQTILPSYDKQILMPFGEYMPLGKIFPILNEMNPNLAIVTPGNDVRVMEMGTAKISPLICYEDLVGYLARRSSQKGANLLVNLTNDAWFGDSLALHQHNRIARFRAIENGRYLVRSTNSGLTSVINPKGQIEQTLPSFASGRIDTIIDLYNHRTVYSHFYGYLFPVIIVILSLIFLLKTFLKRQRHE